MAEVREVKQLQYKNNCIYKKKKRLVAFGVNTHSCSCHQAHQRVISKDWILPPFKSMETLSHTSMIQYHKLTTVQYCMIGKAHLLVLPLVKRRLQYYSGKQSGN